MKIFISIFLIFWAAISNAFDELEIESVNKDMYQFDTFVGPFDTLLPFTVVVHPGKKIYVDSVWAIEILEVIADGLTVSKKQTGETIGSMNLISFEPSVSTFIYKNQFFDLIYGEFSRDDYEYEIYRFVVPAETQELKVSYRLRYPDGSKSKELFVLNAYMPPKSRASSAVRSSGGSSPNSLLIQSIQ